MPKRFTVVYVDTLGFIRRHNLQSSASTQRRIRVGSFFGSRKRSQPYNNLYSAAHDIILHLNYELSHNKAINLNIQNYVPSTSCLFLFAAATSTCYIKTARVPLMLFILFLAFVSFAKKTKLPYSFALLEHKIFKNLFHVRSSPCEEIIYVNVYLHSGRGGC